MRRIRLNLIRTFWPHRPTAIVTVYLTLLFLVIGGVMFTRNPSFGVNNNPQLYRLLSAEPAWLNVSRPLMEQDLRGRVILLDFWTFCCINCQHIVPDLQRLEAEFGDRLLVIGVHSAKFRNEQESAAIGSAIVRYGIHHPVVNDADFRVWQGLGVHSWPTLMLFDGNGRLVNDWSGEGHYADVQSAITRLISNTDAATLNRQPLPIALEKDKPQQRAQAKALSYPAKLAYLPDWQGQPALVISDSGHHRILLTNLDGQILTSIGNGQANFADGDFASAGFNQPQGVLARGDKIYVADTANHRLRLIDLTTKRVSTLAGTGERGNILRRSAPAITNGRLTTPMASPWDLAWYPNDHSIAIAMAGTHQLWIYDTLTTTLSPLAGNGRESIDDGGFPYNSLSQPSGLSVHGDTLYFVDSETSSLRQLKNGNISTLIGEGLFEFGLVDGDRGRGRLQHALGLVASDTGVYIADSYNHALRFYDFKTAQLTTLMGNGSAGDQLGEASNARLNEPNGVILIQNQLWITDTNNHAIRRFDLSDHRLTDWSVRLASVTGADQPTESANAATPIADSTPLPNRIVQDWPNVAAGKPLSLTLKLPAGWHLNAEAPNWLQLDDLTTNRRIQALDPLQLAKHPLTLLALTANHRYRLSGSLYYCPQGDATTCLLASVQQELVLTPSSATTAGGRAEGILTITLP
jgi:thiol-disulfide isomerase/thioredoxin/sugar lactone lactonase YvrE